MFLYQRGQMSAPRIQDSPMVFKNGGPTFSGDQITPCFPHHGNGLLFRIVDSASNTWAFYNDAENFTMKVEYEFGEDSHDLRPLGTCRMQRSPKSVSCTILVPPLETALFVQGKPTKIYNADFHALPLGGWQK